MYQYTNVSMHQYNNVRMYKFISLPVHQLNNELMQQYINTPIYQCYHVCYDIPLFWYNSVCSLSCFNSTDWNLYINAKISYNWGGGYQKHYLLINRGETDHWEKNINCSWSMNIFKSTRWRAKGFFSVFHLTTWQ